MNRILIVEDDQSISNVIDISLKNAGQQNRYYLYTGRWFSMFEKAYFAKTILDTQISSDPESLPMRRMFLLTGKKSI